MLVELLFLDAVEDVASASAEISFKLLGTAKCYFLTSTEIYFLTSPEIDGYSLPSDETAPPMLESLSAN